MFSFWLLGAYVCFSVDFQINISGYMLCIVQLFLAFWSLPFFSGLLVCFCIAFIIDKFLQCLVIKNYVFSVELEVLFYFSPVYKLHENIFCCYIDLDVHPYWSNDRFNIMNLYN